MTNQYYLSCDNPRYQEEVRIPDTVPDIHRVTNTNSRRKPPEQKIDQKKPAPLGRTEKGRRIVEIRDCPVCGKPFPVDSSHPGRKTDTKNCSQVLWRRERFEQGQQKRARVIRESVSHIEAAQAEAARKAGETMNQPEADQQRRMAQARDHAISERAKEGREAKPFPGSSFVNVAAALNEYSRQSVMKRLGMTEEYQLVDALQAQALAAEARAETAERERDRNFEALRVKSAECERLSGKVEHMGETLNRVAVEKETAERERDDARAELAQERAALTVLVAPPDKDYFPYSNNCRYCGALIEPQANYCTNVTCAAVKARARLNRTTERQGAESRQGGEGH